MAPQNSSAGCKQSNLTDSIAQKQKLVVLSDYLTVNPTRVCQNLERAIFETSALQKANNKADRPQSCKKPPILLSS